MIESFKIKFINKKIIAKFKHGRNSSLTESQDTKKEEKKLNFVFVDEQKKNQIRIKCQIDLNKIK